MNAPIFQSIREVAGLLDVPMLATDLPDGTVRVEKGGIAVVGLSLSEAKAEWGRLFAEMIRQPKP